jgi:RNA polymerase sigma factor (sigma-70 family)
MTLAYKDDDSDWITLFEHSRRMLQGLAYRILGSPSDAEDAVQDTFLKWLAAERGVIDNPAAWLTTICTRRCLDMLRAAHRTRVEYVGTWLPEPLHTPVSDDVESNMDLPASLSMAFMLMLERLTPKERAAYLLYEVFDQSYAEVAAALDLAEPACRKLVSRAKSNIELGKVRHTTPLERQDKLLAAFHAAVAGNGSDALMTLLADDIRLRADGGGKVATVSGTLQGKADVVPFLVDKLRVYWAAFEWIPTDLNGSRAYILRDADAVVATVTFAFDDDGQANDIFIVRNPDKLSTLQRAPAI